MLANVMSTQRDLIVLYVYRGDKRRRAYFPSTALDLPHVRRLYNKIRNLCVGDALMDRHIGVKLEYASTANEQKQKERKTDIPNTQEPRSEIHHYRLYGMRCSMKRIQIAGKTHYRTQWRKAKLLGVADWKSLPLMEQARWKLALYLSALGCRAEWIEVQNGGATTPLDAPKQRLPRLFWAGDEPAPREQPRETLVLLLWRPKVKLPKQLRLW